MEWGTEQQSMGVTLTPPGAGSFPSLRWGTGDTSGHFWLTHCHSNTPAGNHLADRWREKAWGTVHRGRSPICQEQSILITSWRDTKVRHWVTQLGATHQRPGGPDNHRVIKRPKCHARSSINMSPANAAWDKRALPAKSNATKRKHC